MQTHIKTFEQLTTKELFNIYKLRIDTFVVEQQCPYHEVDDIDLESTTSTYNKEKTSKPIADYTNKMMHTTSEE